MSLEDYRTALRPKVRGTRNLHLALSNSPLDFFIMLSSFAGIIGNHGQGNYASASTFQDAFARYRTGLGLPSRSLDLGVVDSVGYVSENIDRVKFLGPQGYRRIKVDELFALLSYAIMTPVPDVHSSQIIVGLLTAPQTPHDEKPMSLRDAKFSHLLQNWATRETGGAVEEGENLQKRIREAGSFAGACRLICDAIVEKLAKLLALPRDDISTSHAIASQGADSLIAVELRNWFIRDLETNIAIMDILKSKAIVELAGDVAGRSKLVSPDLLDKKKSTR